MTEFVNFIEDADFNQNKVIIKKLIETPLAKEMQVSIPKDITMKEHAAPHPITIMLIKGDLNFYINEKKHNLKIGDLVYLDPNTMHSLHAIENSIIRLSLAKVDSIQHVKKIVG
ncbi:cupin [Francisella halioticida]|uniref:Cupin n=1 Tax=Francisella halioticida TaxID=549298 RepID=A0ABM6LWY2_9GAMM|nr:AraC family ligand binding domain-containing protein [Francisella halioticida]ASG67078.1 cupin [Francisella halioticida]BCD91973.1 cupin [Francisella halioticida]